MALWRAPFGWDAWRARLSIPFVLASTITSLGLTCLAARDEPKRAAIRTVYVWSFSWLQYSSAALFLMRYLDIKRMVASVMQDPWEAVSQVCLKKSRQCATATPTY